MTHGHSAPAPAPSLQTGLEHFVDEHGHDIIHGPHDAAHAMKRSTTKADIAEHSPHNHPWVVLPTSPVRQFWDGLVAVFVVYLVWKVPFSVCFPSEFLEEPSWKNFDIFLEVFFWCDILLNFRTGHFHNGHLVTDPREIADHYLRGWFVVDIFASFPFEVVFEGLFQKSQRKAVKLWKIFKLSKLLRIGRIVKYLRNYFKFRHLMMLSAALVCISHFSACLWFLVETASDDTRYRFVEDGFGNVGDLYMETLDSVILHLLGIYWAGHIHSTDSAGQHAMSIFVSIIGAVLVAISISSVVVIMSTKSGPREKFREKMEVITAEMEQLFLPEELQMKVKKYYDYLWINKKGVAFTGGHGIFQDEDLSRQLKHEVSVELVKHSIPLKQLELLSYFNDDLLALVFLRMKTRVFFPFDIVCNEGDQAIEMYYNSKGQMTVQSTQEQLLLPEDGYTRTEDGFIICYENTFIAEDALICEYRYQFSIQALTSVELLVLKSSDFYDCILSTGNEHYMPVLVKSATMRVEDLTQKFPDNECNIHSSLLQFWRGVDSADGDSKAGDGDPGHHRTASSGKVSGANSVQRTFSMMANSTVAELAATANVGLTRARVKTAPTDAAAPGSGTTEAPVSTTASLDAAAQQAIAKQAGDAARDAVANVQTATTAISSQMADITGDVSTLAEQQHTQFASLQQQLNDILAAMQQHQSALSAQTVKLDETTVHARSAAADAKEAAVQSAKQASQSFRMPVPRLPTTTAISNVAVNSTTGVVGAATGAVGTASEAASGVTDSARGAALGAMDTASRLAGL